uniref:Uncharacterized protein n=2 Tax=Nothobranchius TaxID=28779 RepID=A0A1A8S4V6_9TELE
MPPKRGNINEEELDDIKKSLNFMSEEITTIAKQQKLIIILIEDIKELRRQSEEKDKKIAMLEVRVAELEQYSRISDVIVTGLETKHQTYARAAAEERGEPPEQELRSLEEQVIAFFNSKGIEMDSKDIEGCHTLPRKNMNQKPAIIIRFVNRKQKKELLKQGRKLKGTNVYVNEHLTKKNADIARQARLLRKQKKIQSTWTSDCKVFIKLNGTPEQAKVLVIKELMELEKYG